MKRLVVIALLVTACGSALGRPGSSPPIQDETGEGASIEPSEPGEPAPAPAGPTLPHGREISRLTPGACREVLDRFQIRYEAVDLAEDAGVETPIRLVGPVGGVTVHSPRRATLSEVMDCRLAVGLLAWSEALRQAGVVRIDSLSTYRPGARVARTGRPSGHARALAIDVGRFHLEDGTVLDIETFWTDRRQGVSPCDVAEDDTEEQVLLRRVICAPIDDDTFQIVLTPHFDRAHRNHIHLELRPDVDWTYVR